MIFNSYHWYGCKLGNPVLEQARATLAQVTERGSARRAALDVLLYSGDTTAIGTALDHYTYAEARTRQGGTNPFAPCAGELRARARDLLRQPPLPASASGSGQEGANHLSALGALQHLAEPSDSALVGDLLAAATSPDLRYEAASVADLLLRESPEPDPRLIRLLAALVMNDAATIDERRTALRAIGHARSADVIPIVLQVARLGNLQLQASAALILVDRDLEGHRPFIEQLVATWPANAPDPAIDVIEILQGAGDEADSDQDDSDNDE